MNINPQSNQNDIETKQNQITENIAEEKSKKELDSKLKENQEQNDEELPPPPPPVDAEALIEVSDDKMKAYVKTVPPQNGGKEISEEEVRKTISESKIMEGLNQESITLAGLNVCYGKKLLIAEGTAPVDGVEGKIEHFFDLNHKNQPKINEDGSVNYKDTGLITNIMEEKPICKMTLPTAPIDGKNVFGENIKGKEAPKLIIPKGKNTRITEDQTLLLSEKRGNLRLENGQYTIDDTIVINGDVDISVGDIKFVGKVEIRGNVREGFTVKSDDDILVLGMVEGAVVEAKGNMELRGGISGMGSSKISCKGDLKTRYIENADVSVGGNLDADYILNSNVSCNGTVKCMGRKGIIVGGNCSAMDHIEAKSIGNDNGSKTSVTVGVTGELAEKRARLVSETNAAKLERDKCDKDMQYLSFKEKSGNLSEERKKAFEKLKARVPMMDTKLKILAAEQEKIQSVLDDGRKSNILCHGKIYPGVTITVASASMTVTSPILNGKFILNEGNIMVVS